MQNTAILYPVFVQVLLTFVVLLRLAKLRAEAIRDGSVTYEQAAVDKTVWPRPAIAVANSFISQFELPTLFYALAAFAMITSRVDIVLVILAWVFVALRIGHAFIHLTHNTVRQRSLVFAAGVVVLFAMWIYFAASVILAALAV